MPEDFTAGGWQPLLADPRNPDADGVSRVVLTSGKVFYDLDKQREKDGRHDVALLRLEQLYPLPVEQIRAALDRYRGADDVVWVQEEPANQGAWPFIALNLTKHLGDGRRLRRVSRGPSSSPAAGSHNAHEVEQAKLLDAVFS
jgi:2-oxoglutarate dehydrogenase E1 component